MRKIVPLSLICGVLLLAATSRSDVAQPEFTSATPLDEPITGTPITPAPDTASKVAPKDPFVPYDVGPANAVWRYTDLTPEERAVVDRGRRSDESRTNNEFARASAEQAKRAAAASAATQLGVAGLAEIGVVR